MTINITLVDSLDPETTAMLQAFYSRHHRPISDRLSTLGNDGQAIKDSLKKWYVGYGHKSIGQCGSTTFFLENVSLLAAKTVQDSRLYNGQETSTRFIDFEGQPFTDPLQRPELTQVWIDFYARAKPRLIEHLMSQFGHTLEGLTGDDLVNGEKAIRARSFDILRAFLPAGVCTQLSWHTTLAHAHDRLVELAYHPLGEIRALARGVIDVCRNRYPSAFSGIAQDIDVLKQYYESCGPDLFYFDPPFRERRVWPEFEETRSYDKRYDYTNRGLNRPKGVPVPRYVSLYGQFEFKYTLDFGSFRDIQRHRDCIQPMPLLTTEMGFEPWYLEQLPDDLRKEADALISAQETVIHNLLTEGHADRIVAQYYTPIGYQVPCVLRCDARELVYISELRSSKTVHPTLRKVAHRMAHIAKSLYLCPVYADTDEADFTLRRGAQDIVERL